MGDLVGDAVKTRDCQQQARDERDEHGHRDEPAGKAPGRLGRIERLLRNGIGVIQAGGVGQNAAGREGVLLEVIAFKLSAELAAGTRLGAVDN